MPKQKRNLSRNLSIAEMSMMGKNQREIAKAHNISQAQVSNVLLKDEDIKPELDRYFKFLVSKLGLVRERFMQLVLSDDDKTASQNISEYHKTMGITQAHPPLQVGQLYIDQRQTVYDPSVIDVINRYAVEELHPVQLIEDKSDFSNNDN